MSLRYRLLFLLVIGSAAAVLLFGRGRPGRAPIGAPAPPPKSVTAEIVIDATGIDPRGTSVPKGTLVTLRVLHRGTAPVSLRLAGYEDRIAFDTIAPGDTVSVTFLADRPGADFAWILNGEPAGRLAVTGSHLEEGHE